MRLFSQYLIFTSLITVLSSCSHFTRRSQTEDEGIVRDSYLSHLNPAPKIFNPPNIDLEIKDSVDPNSAYSKSQSDYHFTLGEALGLDGNSEKAIEEFKLTLLYDPQSVSVRLRLAIEYVRQGLVSEAIEQASEASRLNPRSVEAKILLGGLYSSLKMYAEAIKEYNAILEIDSKNTDARIYMGAILAEQKRYDEAVAMFETLEALFDKNDKYKPYYYIGRVRVEQGGEKNLYLAAQSFQKALQRHPSDVDSVLALSKVYEQQGKKRESLRLLESFYETIGPQQKISQQLASIYLEKDQFEKAIKHLEFLEGFDPEDVSIKFKLGLLYVEKKDFASAIQKFQSLIEMDEEADRPLFYLAAVLEETKQYEEAIVHFLKIPPSSGFYTDAVIHASYLQKLQGRLDAAIETMEKAIEQRDDYPQFYAFLASLLDDKRLYQRAITLLTKANQKIPDHVQLLFFLGSMYDRIGSSEQTIETMKKVIALDDKHVQALNYLAYTYAELALHLEDAELMARKALSLQPKDGYILDTLGWVVFKQNKTAEAIQLLERAYKIQSNESIIAEHLGDAYYKHELKEKARKMYQKAVAIETDKKKIEKIQQKIVAIDNKIDEPNFEKRQPASLSRSANEATAVDPK